MSGKVYLIGAGPGDPGLITVKAVACLRRADVVVYDRLVAPALLDDARAGAEKIYVGKASSDHTLPQNEINALLVQKAREGKIVARLKGGDPFVFGRGGEEALALVDAGIEFEIIPGVSSAIAAPAYAGIPVTHRGIATSFTVATGHLRDDQSPISNLQSPTLIYLMGVENLESIVNDLLAQGHSSETPAALVRWGTTTQQETMSGTLGDIYERGKNLQPPAVLVVGNVVALREKLRWFENRPLFGKRILVTRAREQASELSQMLRELGAEPIELPVIRIAPLDDYRALDNALTQRYDWIIFTSVNGVAAMWRRVHAIGRDARLFAGARLGAIGPATAEQLARYGLRVDFIPSEFVAESIVAGIGDVNSKRILLPRADIAREKLARDLRARGAIVDEIIAYRTIAVDTHDPSAEKIHAMLAADEIDAITFTSSSTVRGFVNAVQAKIEKLQSKIICIGPITAQTARELGLRVDAIAQEYTLEGLTKALVSCWKEASHADTIGQREH
jgi:uroporphyrinogen III methyltransferase/synthase